MSALMDHLFYEESGVQLFCGDALTVLRELPDASVQCCVTSPPYWGLRDYGTATWEGGGAECDHRQQLGGEGSSSAKQNTSAGTQTLLYRGSCGKCGARRIDAQLGLEATPEEYVASLVRVFREVRRVLRDDGTLWLNLGDSYSRDPGKGGSGPNGKHDFIPDYGNARRIMSESKGSSDGAVGRADRAPVRVGGEGLKAKDLVGIPWMVAFALRADGWYLRSDIIWHKPNPMPESVTDRPTKAHEYLFLMSKRATYYYDAEAIEEQALNEGRATDMLSKFPSKNDAMAASDPNLFRTRGRNTFHSNHVQTTRNRRNVWTIPTAPFPGAHFATFPPDLVKPCVLAGSRPGDVVLDPFVGAATVMLVAKELNRRGLGIDLSATYLGEIAVKRLRQGVFLLAQ